MQYVKVTDSPKVGEVIMFELETPNGRGILVNPTQVERVIVYYIEKNVNSNRPIERKFYNYDLEKQYNELLESSAKEEELQELRKKMEETASVSTIYYTDSKIVLDTKSPIWTSDGKVRKIVNLKDGDKDVTGKFAFFWKPEGVREGTYLLRWDWKVNGKTRSAEKLFNLYPAADKINSVYSKFVPRNKYEFLMEKYIPPMYLKKVKENDLTAEVVRKLNKAIGQMFLELDDLAVGLIDLLDPMFIPESLLPLMANSLAVDLKTQSPTVWRNQLKNAVSLYKSKGTVDGLRRALDSCGIRLLKLTNLWQVISPYTWTDGFVVEKDILSNAEIVGYLTKRPIDDFCEVYLKSESNEYLKLPKEIVSFQQTLDDKVAVIWNGGQMTPVIELFQGDVIKITYNYNEMPQEEAEVENYIKKLPLADNRDEAKVKYPLKNWNVKLIKDDDPLFDKLIIERNPYFEPVVYGKVRTTFLYSEKVFNMDTFNGNLYESNDPCDIDKDFVDNCSGGMSSKFDIYVETNELSDNIIKELNEIVAEFSPFHSMLNKIKVDIKTVDIFPAPIDRIKNEIKFKNSNGDKLSVKDSIYCSVKFKDGSELAGKLF